MKTLSTILFSILLAACAVATQKPQQAVFQIKQNYELALTVAVAYEKLPLCAPAAPVLCSDHNVRAKIKQAKDVAKPAVQAAENAVRDPAFDASKSGAILVAAQQAVVALTLITSALKTK